MRRKNYQIIWPSHAYICDIAKKGQLRIHMKDGDHYILLSDIRLMMPVSQDVLRCKLPEIIEYAQIPESDTLWVKTKSSAKRSSLFVHERCLEQLLEFFKRHPKSCDRGKYRTYTQKPR